MIASAQAEAAEIIRMVMAYRLARLRRDEAESGIRLGESEAKTLMDAAHAENSAADALQELTDQQLESALRLLAQQPAPQSAAEENRRLSEALEWYAEPSIYQQEHFEGTGMEYPAVVDGGHSARVALSAAEAPAGRDT